MRWGCPGCSAPYTVTRDTVLQTYHIPFMSVLLAGHGLMLMHLVEVGSLLYLIAQVRKFCFGVTLNNLTALIRQKAAN